MTSKSGAGAPPKSDDDEIAALRAIVEGTARSTGDVFFTSLVSHLASALGVDYAFIAEFAGAKTRVRTIAYWGPGGLLPKLEFDLEGTPCEEVVAGASAIIREVCRRPFPSTRC